MNWSLNVFHCRHASQGYIFTQVWCTCVYNHKLQLIKYLPVGKTGPGSCIYNKACCTVLPRGACLQKEQCVRRIYLGTSRPAK